MPRRGSPYGPDYQRDRARILAGHPRCDCGLPATEADHDPPLAMHRHVNGTGCCKLRPKCGPCQRQQAIELCNLARGRRSRYRRIPPPASRAW